MTDGRKILDFTNSDKEILSEIDRKFHNKNHSFPPRWELIFKAHIDMKNP